MARPARFPRSLYGVAVALTALAITPAARALTLNLPVGGAPALIPGGQVLCGSAPQGFFGDETRRRVSVRRDTAVGHTASTTLAASFADCASHPVAATLVATGAHPRIDPATVTVWVDAGRIDLGGRDLERARIGWRSGEIHGSDTCLNVTDQQGRQSCSLNLPPGLPANPTQIELTWGADGARLEPDSITFDLDGRALATDRTRLPVARLVIGSLFPVTRTLDLTRGQGLLTLPRPGAASTVDCGAAQCDVTGDGVLVSAVPADAKSVKVNVRLRPRVFLASGDQFVTTQSADFTVLRCPVEVVSGKPLRNADEVKVLVRADAECGAELGQMRWSAGGERAQVLRAESLPDGVYVLLELGRTASDRLRLVATRPSDRTVIAVVTKRTWEAPPLRTTLRLPTVGTIDFIPKNARAILSVSSVEGPGELVPIALQGAYRVHQDKGRHYVRGTYASGGYTSLRFAYRIPTLPGSFAEVDYATLTDPVQRPIREANIPAPIGASSMSKRPIVELYCGVEEGRVEPIPSGTAPHIPFAQRDSCRLIVHRSRIPPASGEQHLRLEVSVATVSGADRPEGRLSEQLLLRHGKKRDVIWIRGAEQQFDRISVRVTHVIDESEYVLSGDDTLELPSAQWTIVTESATFKFYATAAIPANLYRFSKDPGDLGTGPLALNFGVLSRLTWLDSTGQEGLVGLELGVMGMGLATDRDRQLALVGGLGIAIPLGNAGKATQAAVNIHTWVAYSVGERSAPLTNAEGEFVRDVRLSPWAFVFGPSITIGSIGTFL